MTIDDNIVKINEQEGYIASRTKIQVYRDICMLLSNYSGQPYQLRGVTSYIQKISMTKKNFKNTTITATEIILHKCKYPCM